MFSDYDVIPVQALLPQLMDAADRLARFDERANRSPLKHGLLARLDFQDAAASLWNDGELVHLEDLVLHDAHMDVRAPTQEVVDATRILRARRHIVSNAPDWALSKSGLTLLMGARPNDNSEPEAAQSLPPKTDRNASDTDDELDDAFKELDQLLNRSSSVLELVRERKAIQRADPMGLFHSTDWNESERLEHWVKFVEAQSHRPGLLQAIVAIDAWEQSEVSQRSAWVGRLLAGAILRQRGVTASHLTLLNVGLKNQPRRQRQGMPSVKRLSLFLNAFKSGADYALAEHDRLLQAKARMERMVKGRRSNSRLPDLVELIIAKPIVSTAMIVDELGTTPQGAVGLANQLELREMTGRGRFRAWGIL